MVMIQDKLLVHLVCQKKVIRLEMKNILRVIQDDNFYENMDNIVEKRT